MINVVALAVFQPLSEQLNNLVMYSVVVKIVCVKRYETNILEVVRDTEVMQHVVMNKLVRRVSSYRYVASTL